MAGITFSKHKDLFLIVFLVMYFVLTVVSLLIGLGESSGILAIIHILNALVIIPAVILVKHKRKLAIVLIISLIINFLTVRVISILQAIIDSNAGSSSQMSVILLGYSIISALMVIIMLVSIGLIHFYKSENPSLVFKRKIVVLGMIASILLLYTSISFSYSSTDGWIVLLSRITEMLRAIIFAVIFIVYFASLTQKEPVMVSTVQPPQRIENKTIPRQSVTKTRIVETNDESYFTGSTFSLVWLNIWTSMVTGITLGLAFPFMLCKKQHWLAKHTFINGRQLQFTGTGMQLFANWIKWSLLTVVTLGFYAFFIQIAIKKWTVSHTTFIEST